MSENQIDEANGRAKEAARSFTTDKTTNNDRQADQPRTTVKNKGNNLVDALPGRGTE